MIDGGFEFWGVKPLAKFWLKPHLSAVFRSWLIEINAYGVNPDRILVKAGIQHPLPRALDLAQLINLKLAQGIPKILTGHK
jgi:hypothetical protein